MSLVLACDDVAATASLYSAVLNWPSSAGHGNGQVVLGGTANRPLGHIADAASHPLLRGAGWAPFFNVADVNAAATALDRAGIRHASFPHGTGRPALVARDPSGAAFGLAEPAEAGPAGFAVHAELATDDMEGAAAFYGALLGVDIVEVVDDIFDYRAMTWQDLIVSGFIDLGEFDRSGAPPHWMPYFRVDDVDRQASRALVLGALLQIPPADSPIDRYAVLADGNGVTFGISAGVSWDRAGLQRLNAERVSQRATGRPAARR
jgi:uncharacterized protein